MKSFFRSVRGVAKQEPAAESSEWLALGAAISARDFSAISPCMRAWSMHPSANFEQLQVLTKSAALSKVEAEKIEILYEYYARNMEVAFARAQEHMEVHGLDLDLHVISLVSLYQTNQFEAAQSYQQRLNAEEASTLQRADYWQMVAVIRWAVNDMKSLPQAIDRALELSPNDGALLQTALGMYVELGNLEKIAIVRAKLEECDDSKGYAHSLCLLALGEHEEGWRQMEARYENNESHRFINQGLRKSPRWLGESLAGLRLLVSAEQGLGDTIQMARYLPLLQTLDAAQILLEVQPEAITLLQYNFPDIPIVERKWAQSPEFTFDCWTALMSLPLHLKAWGNDALGKSGYLTVPPENREYWAGRVAQLSQGTRPRVGLAWSGQPNHRGDRRRSIPFETIRSYLRNNPVSFFALQTTVPSGMPTNVLDVSEELITLADTAALIEQMDLVITVDTSVVHIAGAMGKPTWLLLPKRYEWRWGLEGESNDWYDSVKVMRQQEHSNWKPVLEEVFGQRLRIYSISRGFKWVS